MGMYITFFKYCLERAKKRHLARFLQLKQPGSVEKYLLVSPDPFLQSPENPHMNALASLYAFVASRQRIRQQMKWCERVIASPPAVAENPTNKYINDIVSSMQ